jgi:glycosyltransferase involved in cell wall biosynthesis
MKILHIIDSAGLYGAEIMLLNLNSEQKHLCLEPTIASIGEKGIDTKPVEAEADLRGLAVQKFRMGPGPNITGALQILNYAHQEGFDILHTHGYKGNILFGFMPEIIRRLPIVSTLHGYTSVEGLSRMRIYEWLDARSLKYFDAVVLVNKALRNHPKLRMLKGVRFHVVNNGIPELSALGSSGQSGAMFLKDPGSLGNDVRELQVIDFCRGKRVIGAIGRLSKEKAYHYLIDVLCILRNRGFDVVLVIIGEGSLRASLEEKIAELGLDGYVLIPGYLPNAARLIRCFDVFLISSLTEGLPINLLEAMHSEVPVVATAVGGIPETLNHGRAGILVKPKDSHEMAQATEKLLSDRELSTHIASKAKHRVRSCYSSKIMAEAYLKIYEQVSAAD